MKNIAFLCSGGGGNMRFVAAAIDAGWLSGRLCAVITDRECLANRFAREHGLPTMQIDFSEMGQSLLMQALTAIAPDIIVTNVHRILAPGVVQAFRGRLINLHYSLLPAFGGTIGTRPVSLALASGSQFIGVTAHEVEVVVDSGSPIVQTAIPVADGDTTENVMDLVFRVGCLTLLNALRIHSGATATRCQEMSILGRSILMNPGSTPSIDFPDELFWAQIGNYPPEARC
jgi:phosphoribosylglycinamide formyltransferase 1